MRESPQSPTSSEYSDTDYAPKDRDPEPLEGEEVREIISFCGNIQGPAPVEVIWG